MRYNLKWLLGELTPATFTAGHFEKKMLFVNRNHPDYYQAIISFDELDNLTTATLLNPHSVRMAKNGKLIAEENYQKKYLNTLFISNEKLLDEFADGGTIILEGIHRYHHAINLLCKKLQEDLRSLVLCNCYITPPEKYGFPVHFDTHCVLILQLHGTKLWRLYSDRSQRLPTTDIFHKGKKSRKQFKEILMQPGDLLYLPRGVYHEAISQHQISAHLTIGIYPFLQNQFFAQLLNDAAAVRTSLRKGLIDKNASMKNLKIRTTAKALQELLERNIMENDTWTVQRSRLTGISKLYQIQGSSLICIKPGISFRFIKSNGKINLEFNSKQIWLPNDIVKEIKNLRSAKQFGTLFNGYTKATKVDIVRNLVKSGFLDIENP